MKKSLKSCIEINRDSVLKIDLFVFARQPTFDGDDIDIYDGSFNKWSTTFDHHICVKFRATGITKKAWEEAMGLGLLSSIDDDLLGEDK